MVLSICKRITYIRSWHKPSLLCPPIRERQVSMEHQREDMSNGARSSWRFSCSTSRGSRVMDIIVHGSLGSNLFTITTRVSSLGPINTYFIDQKM